MKGQQEQGREKNMAKKAYWVSAYRSIKNPDAVAAYAKLAGPALKARGAKYLAVGVANEAYEAGLKQLKQRMVIIEWPSLQAAIDAHDSAEYQAALKVFNNAAERDFRILEAME
jgi:uncharacterized protein (DUF1330 family)